MTITKPLRIKQGLHFLPVVIMYILFIHFFLLPDDEKLESLNGNDSHNNFIFSINITVIWISGVLYTGISLFRLFSYKKSIKNHFSNTEKINFNWLKYLLLGFVIIWILILFVRYDPLIFGSSVVFISWIGYFGIKQLTVFKQISVTKYDSDSMLEIDQILTELKNEEQKKQEKLSQTNNEQNTLNYFALESEKSLDRITEVEQGEKIRNNLTNKESNSTRYHKSNLSSVLALQIHEQLNQTIANDKIFTNPDLTLNELANSLNVHPNNLSQVINSLENKTFYDYINEKRINEFLRVVELPESQKYTFLSLAFECGFNSKTAFNRNFKKIIGFTPSEYMKRNKRHM